MAQTKDFTELNKAVAAYQPQPELLSTMARLASVDSSILALAKSLPTTYARSYSQVKRLVYSEDGVSVEDATPTQLMSVPNSKVAAAQQSVGELLKMREQIRSQEILSRRVSVPAANDSAAAGCMPQYWIINSNDDDSMRLYCDFTIKMRKETFHVDTTFAEFSAMTPHGVARTAGRFFPANAQQISDPWYNDFTYRVTANYSLVTYGATTCTIVVLPYATYETYGDRERYSVGNVFALFQGIVGGNMADVATMYPLYKVAREFAYDAEEETLIQTVTKDQTIEQMLSSFHRNKRIVFPGNTWSSFDRCNIQTQMYSEVQSMDLANVVLSDIDPMAEALLSL